MRIFDRNHFNKVWKITYPIILGNLAQVLVLITDTAFLGRVGANELAAVALGGIFYQILTFIGVGLAMGAQITIARRIGEKKKDQAGAIHLHSVVLNLVLAFFLFLITRLGLSSLSMIINDQIVAKAAIDYLDIRSFGVFLVFFNYSHRAFFTGISKTGIIMWSTVAMTVVNIFLDYGLIFGNLGFSEMGIRGAALASFCAEIVGGIVLTAFISRQIYRTEFNVWPSIRLEVSRIIAMLKLGAPLVVQLCIGLSGWFVFFLFIENLGTDALATSNVIRNLYAVLMMPTWGFAAATNTIISEMIGEGKGDKILKESLRIAQYSFLLTLTSVLSAFYFTEELMSIFTDDSALIQAGVDSMYVVYFALLLFSISTVLFNTVTATGATLISLFMEVVGIILYLIYVYVVIAYYEAGLTLVWTSEIIYWTLLIPMSLIFIRLGTWKKFQL